MSQLTERSGREWPISGKKRTTKSLADGLSPFPRTEGLSRGSSNVAMGGNKPNSVVKVGTLGRFLIRIRGELETNRLTIKAVRGRSSLSVSTETSGAAEKRTGGRMTVRGDPFLTQIST
jgi:hypothetical protein